MLIKTVRYFGLGSALLCAGCASGPTTYQLQNLDADAFRHDYAECTKKRGDYLFTYDRNPLDPTSPFEKCMRDRGYQMSRPE